MTKDSSTNNIFLKQQVEPLFDSTLTGGLANIFAVWLVYVLVMDTHHNLNALLLSVSVTSLSLLRIFVSEYYLRFQSKNLKLFLRSHIALTFFIGVAWGLFELTQSSDQDAAIRNMVYLINFGLIAGSLATLSVWLPAYIAYVLPQSICIFAVLAMQNTELSLLMAVAFFVFIIIMVSGGLTVHRGHKQELILKFRNNELIDDLNSEVMHRTRTQMQLEDSKHHLEEKVKERTIELQIINNDLKKEISEKRKVEKSLEYIAYHDELTDLPNKNLLLDRIRHSIETAHRNKQKLGILFIDLDRFKAINDSLGHIIGDKLIQEVAKRLINTLRSEERRVGKECRL